MSSAMQSLMTDEEWKALDSEVEEELRLEAARKKLAIMSSLVSAATGDPYIVEG